MTETAAAKVISQPVSGLEDSEVKPWKEKCSFGCYHAKGKKKKCKCRCGGKLHGKARDEHNEKLRIAELKEPS